MRTWRAIALLALLTWLSAGVLTGCQSGRPRGRPTGEHHTVDMADAPADLQAFYERMKEIPGLYVLPSAEKTYLLLVGGKQNQPMRVELMDVATQFGGANQVRIMAALRPGAQAAYHPYALLQMEVPSSSSFRARLSMSDGQVTELSGMTITGR